MSTVCFISDKTSFVHLVHYTADSPILGHAYFIQVCISSLTQFTGKSEDLDHMPHDVASDLDLLYLQASFSAIFLQIS